MKSLLNYGKHVFLIGIVLILIANSLSCIAIKKDKIPSFGKKDTTTVQTVSSKTRPHPPVRTGEITLGTRVQIGSQPIGKNGGGITVARPGDPLNGLEIGIPPNAYTDTRTFTISYAPVTNHTFGDDFIPASPMITIDNGGGYSNQLMTVRIPVKIPDNHFAMGFLYDSKTKQLEGMPLLAKDANSITVGTRRFSDFLVGMVDMLKLKTDVDSGFRPGIDDWQFTNWGSFIAPGGHCMGQALTAMWYYCTTPDGRDACLYNRYDNNGKQPATPNLWQDDSWGYRLCSVVQHDLATDLSHYLFWHDIAGKSWQKVNNQWQWVNVPKLVNDADTRNLFLFSIQMTGEPQYVDIRNNDGGHAMIVYKVAGNALYIADPNYPGNTDRKIIYYSGEGKFKPYNSGANRKEIDAGRGINYDQIFYMAKSTIFPWDKIAQRWTEFKNGTIGNDKFPQYKINVVDDDGKVVALTDGFSTKNKKLRVSPTPPLACYIYRDSKKLEVDRDSQIELMPGNNLLGFEVLGNVNNKWTYVDFKYFNVKYEAEVECKTPPPADVMAKLHKTTRFYGELLNLPTTIEGSGSMQKWVPGFKFTKQFYIPGNARKLEGERSIPITWSGTSFRGGGSKEYPDKLTGSVCYSNGQVLVSFDYQTNDPADNLKISVKNLPCDPKRLMKPESGNKPELVYMNTEAPVVKKYVTRLEWTSYEERPTRGGPPEVWNASLTSADWSNKCGFWITIY